MAVEVGSYIGDDDGNRVSVVASAQCGSGFGVVEVSRG